jgi:hypothetical protein
VWKKSRFAQYGVEGIVRERVNQALVEAEQMRTADLAVLTLGSLPLAAKIAVWLRDLSAASDKRQEPSFSASEGAEQAQ